MLGWVSLTISSPGSLRKFINLYLTQKGKKMSNYNSLKTTIDANIKQNGRQEITGQILNSVLNQMVTTLGTGYQFAGVATIATDPGTLDAKVFYIANGKGTYEKFDSINVTEDEVVVLYYDAEWHKVATGIASQEKLTELGQEMFDFSINQSRNLAILDLMENNAVSSTDNNGYYCTGTRLVNTGAAQAYGVLSIPVNAGDIIKVKTDINYIINGGYANVFFVNAVQNNEKPYIIGYIPENDKTETEAKNYFFIAPKNGFIGVSYFSNQQSKIHFYKYSRDVNVINSGDITTDGPAPGVTKLPRASETFEQLRVLSKNLGVVDILQQSVAPLTDLNGAYLENGKLKIGPTGYTYGVRYVSVNAGDILIIKTKIGYVINADYSNVAFVEQIQNDAPISIIGYTPVQNVTESEEKKYFFIAPKDGYVCVSYFLNQSASYEIISCDTKPKQFITESEATQAYVKNNIPLVFSNIGTIYYTNGTKQSGLGDSYACTDMLDVTGFRYITGKFRGNTAIASVLFLDENKVALTDLSIATNGLVSVTVDLSLPEYVNVRYIVSSVQMSNGGGSFGTLKTDVLYNGDISLDDYSKKVCKYMKYSAIGDSLTNASPWINTVKDILNIGTVTRAGASGLTMADVAGQNSIHGSIMEMVADNDVDLISVWAGTNDFAYNVPLGDFETQYAAAQRNTTTFYGAYMDSIEHLLAVFPKARIFLIGTTDRIWRTENSGNPWSDAMVNTMGSGFLPDYVEAVKKLAERYGLPFLDLLHTSGINKHNIDQYMFLQTSSGTEYYLHFNNEFGTQQIAQRIAAFINSIG